MKAKNNPVQTTDQKIRGLCDLVERRVGGRYHSHDIFRWMMGQILHNFGLAEEELTPNDAKAVVDEVLNAYMVLVANETPFTDILGPLYMVLASHGSKQVLGQFFTPSPIATFMAAVLLGNGTTRPDGSPIRACDPTAGSGVMMLSLCQEILKEHGPRALRQYSITCVDLDNYCARMCAVQFLVNLHVHNLTLGEIAVYQGNSLLPGDNLRVVVHGTAEDINPEDIVPATHPCRLNAIRMAAESRIGEQLALFDDSAAVNDESKKVA